MIDTSIFSRFDFHDLPVSGITITTEPYLAVTVGVCPFNEERQEYDYFKLHFTEVEALHLGEINFVAKTDLDVSSCDYEVKDGEIDVTFTLLDAQLQSALLMITGKVLLVEQYNPKTAS